MPKRVIDFDALWASDKISACAEWAQAEYAWLYGLADCAGCFELTNLRVIWGRVAAVRRNFSMERLEQVFAEFQDKGLLFVWNESGKRYGHWTGSDVPGRLPPPSWRNRLERLAPAVPREQFGKYIAAHSVGMKNKSRCESLPDGTSAACGRELPNAKVDAKVDLKELQAPIEFEAEVARVEPVGLWRDERSVSCSSAKNVPSCFPRRANASRSTNANEPSRGRALKACLEEPQAQDLELDLDPGGNWEKETHTLSGGDAKSVCEAEQIPFKQKQMQKPFEEKSNSTTDGTAKSEKVDQTSLRTGRLTASTALSPEAMREIWQQERGELPELRALSPERAARCRERISHAGSKGKSIAQFLADFREAVARASATPFLCGEGPAGWRANFDWLVADDTNYLKVLEGRYDAGAGSSANANVTSPREEAVRRELLAGAGPLAEQNSTRVRAGVIDRVLHRE
jgi:hypothetical protein